MEKKILYKRNPLTKPEYHPEVLRNGMTKGDVAKVQGAIQEKAEEAKAAQRDASQTWRDRIASLMLSRTLVDVDNGDLACWFSGQRFSDVSSIRAHFGKNMENLKRVGPRYVTGEDISELARIVGNIRRRRWAARVANKFLRLDEENKDTGRIIVGWKPGRNYVIAASHEICRSGSVAITGRGRNIGKVHAIVELLLEVWPGLNKLGEQNGSEMVNGKNLTNVEIRLGA